MNTCSEIFIVLYNTDHAGETTPARISIILDLTVGKHFLILQG